MKITFLGGGNMANAIIGGLREQGFASEDIRVVEPLAANREQLGAAFGVRCVAAMDADALSCDVLVLAVKPQQLREAVTPLAGKLERQLVISIAAGVRMADLGRWLGSHARLVRVMPNTPALIGAGISGLWADAGVDEAGRAAAEKILGAVGRTLWIADEAQMDAITAVSGSGPAYVFYFIEALRDAGRELGLPADTANRLAIETVLGAARLAARSDDDVAVLRQRVTSKGGTTEAALFSMAQDHFKDIVVRAVRAASDRSRELGDELGKG
jgi:pyrroline-5-carboxylate reductase